MKRYLIVVIALCSLALPSLADVTLYDAGLGAQTPDQQNLYYLALDPAIIAPIAATHAYQAAPGPMTVLNSLGDQSESAGYYNYDVLLSQPVKTPLTLDRTGDGYTVRMKAIVYDEDHVSTNRAGLSLIALSSDGWGIELGFWEGSIWAQEDDTIFTQAESANFDTTAAMTTYDLAIAGSTYTLYADGNEVLTGALRRYADYVANNLTYHVYHQPDFVFVGDNTSSASAEIGLAEVSVLASAVPEPASMSILAVGTLVLLKRRSLRA